jgi:hypothetical protein
LVESGCLTIPEKLEASVLFCKDFLNVKINCIFMIKKIDGLWQKLIGKFVTQKTRLASIIRAITVKAAKFWDCSSWELLKKFMKESN